jgi:hypothetical protein
MRSQAVLALGKGVWPVSPGKYARWASALGSSSPNSSISRETGSLPSPRKLPSRITGVPASTRPAEFDRAEHQSVDDRLVVDARYSVLDARQAVHRAAEEPPTGRSPGATRRRSSLGSVGCVGRRHLATSSTQPDVQTSDARLGKLQPIRPSEIGGQGASHTMRACLHPDLSSSSTSSPAAAG